jgi:hypothetical protein
VFGALLLAQALVGCGSATLAQADANAGTPAATAVGQMTPGTGSQATDTPATTAVPTSQPSSGQTTPTPQSTVPPLVLHGPTNFVLKLPFTFSVVNGATNNDSGVTTPIDPSTIKTNVTQELQHLLFVVDSSNRIKVYSQGTAPISAQLTYNADGSAAISYTQTTDSEAGTVTLLFAGVLSKQQIAVRFEQQFNPSIMINAQASDIVVVFTAPVQWVAANEIPAAPSNGNSQFTSQGGVALAWSAGQNASAYDVYRQISDVDQQFHLLTTVKGTSYSDNSPDAIKNLHSTKGMTYAIFSVGPTGVENPGGIIISV